MHLLNEKQFYLFDQILTSQTGQLYSYTTPYGECSVVRGVTSLPYNFPIQQKAGLFLKPNLKDWLTKQPIFLCNIFQKVNTKFHRIVNVVHFLRFINWFRDFRL